MWEIIEGLNALEWALAIAGALIIGVSKGGFAGIGMLGIVLMAFVVPARQSVGLVLPMLIAADIVAVKLFWRHAMWDQIKRVMPPAILGLLIGWAGMGLISGEAFRVVIGIIVLIMIGLQLVRSRAPEKFRDIPHSAGFAWTLGILAGVSTMMANAAGPVMTLFLLSMGLPKNNFVGTAACFFFIINLIKVPMQSQLGLINPASLMLDLCLVPFLWGGVFLGKHMLQYLKQNVFEAMILALTAFACLELIFGWLQDVKKQADERHQAPAPSAERSDPQSSRSVPAQVEGRKNGLRPEAWVSRIENVQGRMGRDKSTGS